MLVAAALVIPAMIVDEAGSSERLQTVAVVLNYAIWLAFVFEAAVMLWVTPDRVQWVRKHPVEIIIVVLTPPFFRASLQSLRALRLLRLVRLLRLAPLVRRLFTRQGLHFTALAAFLTALAGGAAFHEVESGESFLDGLYWAITTMTTVGYGDLSPQTTAGKAVTVAVMLVGIGFVALLTGAVAEAFIRSPAEAGRAVAPKVEHATDPTEEQLLVQVREISARLAALEQALQRCATLS